MSLETRMVQMRQEAATAPSYYSVIVKILKADSSVIHTFFQNRSRGLHQDTVDAELADIYELAPAEIPALALPSNLAFFSGFSYVGRQWYPWLNAVVISRPEQQQFLDQEMGRFFPDRAVTAKRVREALAVDPSAATWLEQMARVHFRNDNLELIGALKVITGARKMYEGLVS